MMEIMVALANGDQRSDETVTRTVAVRVVRIAQPMCNADRERNETNRDEGKEEEEVKGVCGRAITHCSAAYLFTQNVEWCTNTKRATPA